MEKLHVSHYGAYAQPRDMLAELCAPTARAIPAVDPGYGKMMYQARRLRATAFRTATVQPMQCFARPERGAAEYLDSWCRIRTLLGRIQVRGIDLAASHLHPTSRPYWPIEHFSRSREKSD